MAPASATPCAAPPLAPRAPQGAIVFPAPSEDFPLAFELTGRHLAHYELLRPLGAGAMSEVYLARDTQLHKEVAVKVILDSIARKADLVVRFEREARASGRLDHPNVATVYYFGRTEDGAPFYAMELIDGWSLQDVIEGRIRFRIDQVLGFFAQTCAGLEAALQSGIVHRDIKPANLMVSRQGVVKIVDFGLAKLSDDKSLTRSGTMLGTPYYIAPEIVRGQPADHRADVYSLAVTFFHLLTGFPPYEAETPYGVMMQHIGSPLPDLARANPKLPDALVSMLTAMFAKDPNARPSSWPALQVQATRIARELPPIHGMAKLAFCRNEQRNTIEQAGRCSLCQQPYSAGERAARFHVDIVGWHRNDAQDAAAAWIANAVGRKPAEMRPMLDTLPFRAAFKTPRDRARRMQKAFYELGADMSLVPAEEQGSLSEPNAAKELTFRAHFPPEPDGFEKTAIPTLARTGDPSRSVFAQAKARPSVVVAGLLGLGCAVLLALLMRERTRPIPDDSPPATARIAAAPPREPATPAIDITADAPPAETETAPTETGAVEPVPEAATPTDAPADVAPAAEPAPLTSNRFDVSTATTLDDEPARAALRIAEDELDTLLADLGVDPPRNLPLRLADEAARGRSYTRASWAPAVELPATSDAATVRAAARLLLTRAVMRRAGGASVPTWLLVGASLLREGSEDTEPPPAGTDVLAMSVRNGSNDAGTERALRGFASHLVARGGWKGVGAVLANLQRGGTVDASFVRGLGGTPAELQEDWLAAGLGE